MDAVRHGTTQEECRWPGVSDERRGLAMLPPGADASLSHEEAMRLITEVVDLRQFFI